MSKLRTAGIWAGAVALTGAGLALFSQWQGRRAEAQVPPDGQFIEVEGARLHYTDQGQGSPIVMVHGLGGQLRNFSYALAEIIARDHRVILIDRPRSGYSTVPAGSEPGVIEQAAIIARGIRALGLDRPLFVGHSLGGAVGLALALNDPGLVSGLALISPLTQPQPAPPAVFRGLSLGGATKAGRLVVASTVAVPLGTLTSPATLKAVFAPEPVPDNFSVRGGALLALRPANVAASMFEIGRASDEMTTLAPRYGELTLPVSILFAREDHVLNHARDGEITATQIARCRLELVDGGHMLPVTQPARTAAFIARALMER